MVFPQRSILQVARDAKAKAEPALQPPPTQPAPQATRPAKNKPPVVGHESVVALCGHTVVLELYADKADKYRDASRLKLQKAPCPPCRHLAAEERKVKEQALAAERAKLRSPRARRDNGRLPDGARFAVIYDAARQEWSGSLSVAGVDFAGKASGVFRLLSDLDRQYRQSLGGKDGEG